MNGTKERKGYYGWVIVLLAFLVMFVVFVASISCNGLFVVPVCEDFGIGRGKMTLYLTITSLASMACSPFAGKLMGKYGPRKVGSVFIALLALSMFGFSWAPNIYVIYAFSVLRGVGFCGSTILLVNTMLSNWFALKKLGLATGLAMTGSSFGGFVMLPLITNVIGNHGWRWGYRILGIIVAVMIPVIALLAADSPEKKGLRKLGDTGDTAKPVLVGLTLAQAKKTAAFRWMLVGILFKVLTSGCLSAHAVPYFTEVGFTPARASLVASTGLLLTALGKLVLGRINDRKGGRAVINLGVGAMALGYLCMFLIGGAKAFAIPYVMCYCFGQAVTTMCVTILVANIFGNRDFARIVSFALLADNLGNAVGPMLFGLLRDAVGSYRPGWLLMLGLVAVAYFCFRMSLRSDYRQE